MYRPLNDKDNVPLFPGDKVRFCVPASKWGKDIWTGTIIVDEVLPQRYNEVWMPILAIQPDHTEQIWICPSEAIQKI